MLEMFSTFDKRKPSVDVSTPKVKGLRELKNLDCTLSPVKCQRRRSFSRSNNDWGKSGMYILTYQKKTTISLFPLKCIRVGGNQGCFGGCPFGFLGLFFGFLFGSLCIRLVYLEVLCAIRV
jgi:hypothetical protein